MQSLALCCFHGEKRESASPEQLEPAPASSSSWRLEPAQVARCSCSRSPIFVAAWLSFVAELWRPVGPTATLVGMQDVQPPRVDWRLAVSFAAILSLIFPIQHSFAASNLNFR